LLEPVPLIADTEFHDAGRRHRLVHAPGRGPLATWVLQAYLAGGWEAQYAFTVEPFEPPDFEVINWHIATNPRSPFARRLYVQRLTPDAHLLLDGDRVTETRADDVGPGRVRVSIEERRLTGEAETRRVLAEDFGIDAPEGLRLTR
ncbi:arylamine N-acetyltransferase, partial [Streptomyces sp. SID5910]|uniref:arylamine N-acetyltransferase family protein n=1 Tax=Streptomyces sp. SID5910 TaxID=2690312 RepID=UPI00136BF7D6